MEAEQEGYHEEHGALDDAALVRRIRERQDADAFTELVRRHLKWAVGGVVRQTRPDRRSQVACEEAEEQALWCLFETIRCLPLPVEGQPLHGSFRRMLGQVITHDVQDAGRRRFREAKPFISLDGVRGCAPCLADGQANPARLAERKEVLDALHAVLDGLGPEFRLLWREKEAGGSLRGFAREQEMPCGRVHRRWGKGVVAIQARLAHHFE
jgi:hypothetical protein